MVLFETVGDVIVCINFSPDDAADYVCGEIRFDLQDFWQFYPTSDKPLCAGALRKLFEKVAELNGPRVGR